MIEGALSLWWGSDPQHLASPVGQGTIHVFGGAISYQQLVVISSAVVLSLGALLVFRRTSLGRSLRAVSVNREVAQLLGIRIGEHYAIFAFAISAALAAVGGFFTDRSRISHQLSALESCFLPLLRQF